MIILAIETSCDDTCVAILEIRNKKLKILSNIISSQVKLHAKYGGIHPGLAKREHERNLPLVLKKALSKAKMPKIDLIAVTVGPGLEPCLWTGINFAKELAKKMNLAIIPVNHIEAHIFANFVGENFQFSIFNFQKFFPAICLVVSGGHTQLIIMKKIGKYKIIGETRDDAAGECFDKTARILGLSYPGGPAIAAEAKKLQTACLQTILPRPMIYQKNYDFSFSGLKTAVLYKVKSQISNLKSQKFIQVFSYEIQQAIIDVLIKKTIRATKDYKVKTIILGGGVTANEELRKQFKSKAGKLKINFFAPAKKFCVDNATMIGITAYFQWLKEKTKKSKKISANANLRIS